MRGFVRELYPQPTPRKGVLGLWCGGCKGHVSNGVRFDFLLSLKKKKIGIKKFAKSTAMRTNMMVAVMRTMSVMKMMVTFVMLLHQKLSF